MPVDPKNKIKMIPTSEDFWFLPLGGCGEIGMNFNLYGHDHQWLLVDCCVTFDQSAGQHADQLVLPDPAFISAQKESIAGLVVTHAHEDHLGAIPWLWDKLQCPIYTTAFTAELLRRKLEQHKPGNKIPIRTVDAGDVVQMGVFTVEWAAQTHSIPEPCGLLITTDVARVYHSADWKFEDDPLIGAKRFANRMVSIGETKLDALVCDSTNANVKGHSHSERSLYAGLHQIISNAPGRVVVACFGTNIARLKTLAAIADASQRHLGLLGRSLQNTVSAARVTGIWQHSQDIVQQEHLAYLPPESLLLVATGSQAENRSALNRMSQGNFKDLELDAGDTVIISARKIPGNETGIEAMIERLRLRGITVITPDDTELLIHASGHPAAAELAQLYGWLKPELLIPVHGEPEHLRANTALAKSVGIRHQLQGQNGDLFQIAPNHSIRRNAVSAGRLKPGKNGLIPVVQ